MDMDDYKDMYEDGFWFEMQEIANAVNELAHKYDLDDKILSCFVVGLLEPETEDTSRMKALFHYNIQNRDELRIITEFMSDTYEKPKGGPDLDDLLDGLGISLN